jgi:hypothetical protein
MKYAGVFFLVILAVFSADPKNKLTRSMAAYERSKETANQNLVKKQSSLMHSYEKATIALAKQKILELEKIKLDETRKNNLETALAAKEQITLLKEAIDQSGHQKPPQHETKKPLVDAKIFSSQLNFIPLKEGGKIWTNRDYRIVNVPKLFLAYKCSRVNADSKKVTRLSIVSTGVVYILSMGPDNNKQGESLRKKGWLFIEGHETYFTDTNTNPVSIFMRQCKKGESIMIPAFGDYSILKKK